MSQEFYVGYVSHAPGELARWLRRTVVALVAGAGIIAVVVAASQGPFASAFFEYGQSRTFKGVVREGPAPALALESGRTALLVAPGKHGAADLMRGYDGREVDMAGTRIERDGSMMIEAVPGSIRASGPAHAPVTWINEGVIELMGEIVDSKCYLGVMIPGEGKVHRDCAARCISGGIPPALVARDASGARKLFVLTGPNGRTVNRELLPYVGEPVAVHGPAFRSGDQLRIEIESVRRLE